jgi:hypothetical protein
MSEKLIIKEAMHDRLTPETRTKGELKNEEEDQCEEGGGGRGRAAAA